jgi:hypothetical protein
MIGPQLLLKEIRRRELWPAFLKRQKYSDDQPRDDQGQWTDGGGGGTEGGSTDTPVGVASSPEETAALDDYTDFGYAVTNGYLRGDQKLAPRNAQEEQEIQARVAALDRLIARETVAQQTVWRGFVHPEFAANAKNLVGKTISDPAFTSTTRNPDLGKSYAYSNRGGVMFVITIPNGAHALTVPETNSVRKSEQEMLLPRGASFHVSRVDYGTGTYGNAVPILHMELRR